LAVAAALEARHQQAMGPDDLLASLTNLPRTTVVMKKQAAAEVAAFWEEPVAAAEKILESWQ
jgi:hypothetical protein